MEGTKSHACALMPIHKKVTLIWKKPYENGAFLEHGDKQHIANDKVDHTL